MPTLLPLNPKVPSRPASDKEANFSKHRAEGLFSQALNWACFYTVGPAVHASWWSLVGMIVGMSLGKVLARAAARRVRFRLNEGLSALAGFIGFLTGCAVVLLALGVFPQLFPAVCGLAVIGFSVRVLFACLWRIPAGIGRHISGDKDQRRFLGGMAGATANMVIFGLYVIFLGMVMNAISVLVGGSASQRCSPNSPS